MAPPDQHVVILGSGIVGLCTAYYILKLSPSARVVVVEASPSGEIASGASRYAGGFIAGAWQDPPSLPLSALSYTCHKELAAELGGADRWGYRECGATGLNVGSVDTERSAYRNLPGGKGRESVGGKGDKLPTGTWVEGEKEELSLEGGVAQIDPADFCQTLYKHLTTAYSSRFSTVFGKPVDITPRSTTSTMRTLFVAPNPKFTSRTATFSLPLHTLVVAAGPWSAAVCAELDLPPIPLTNLPGHSLLIRPAPHDDLLRRSGLKELPSEAVFAGISGAVGGVHASTSGLARGLTEEEKREGYTRSPELFVRTNGLIYVAGENSIPSTSIGGVEKHFVAHGKAGGKKDRQLELMNKLTPTVDDVKLLLDPACVGRLKRAAGAVSPLLKEENGAVIEKEQFCYRPVSPDREPIVGELEPGILIATAHGPWGITLAPGTGKVIAEKALGQRVSADIYGLRPQRFEQQPPQIKAKL
ncbi:hypothetical protein JCM6882_003166 [Rhodosporidiobolus microsporus]